MQCAMVPFPLDFITLHHVWTARLAPGSQRAPQGEAELGCCGCPQGTEVTRFASLELSPPESPSHDRESVLAFETPRAGVF